MPQLNDPRRTEALYAALEISKQNSHVAETTVEKVVSDAQQIFAFLAPSSACGQAQV